MSAGKTPLPLQRPPGYRDPNMPIDHPPPQKGVKLPPSFQHAKRRRGCCRTCCCCFCISLVILILVSVSASLTFYLWLQPRLPQIQLKSIMFTRFHVDTTPDGPVLTAASTVGVEIKNPNQNLDIVYGSSHVLLSAVNGDVSLGEDTVGGFTQSKDNVTRLKLVLRVEKQIIDGKSSGELKKGFKNKNLLLTAQIRSGIGLQKGRWATSPLPVEVVCEGLRLMQIVEGGSMPKCRIKLFNWFFIN